MVRSKRKNYNKDRRRLRAAEKGSEVRCDGRSGLPSLSGWREGQVMDEFIEDHWSELDMLEFEHDFCFAANMLLGDDYETACESAKGWMKDARE